MQPLRMSRDECKRRWRAMMDNVEMEDVVWWRGLFTDALMGKDAPAPLPADNDVAA
jgi:trehalose 6-phosphate synthase